MLEGAVLGPAGRHGAAVGMTGAVAVNPRETQEFEILRGMSEHILEAAVKQASYGLNGGWTLQGLGMLRLYIDRDKKHRLHVWDDRYIATPKPSELHTHPWHMYSYIVAGEIHNERFVRETEETYATHPHGSLPVQTWMEQTILCGTGGGLCDTKPEMVWLVQGNEELYGEGRVYKQRADEIHRSRPLRGTVTVVSRGMLDDTDHASVFWPTGQEWITAEPRPATPEEVYDICSNALETWYLS